MLELITIAIFLWLMVKAIGLVLKLTWGTTKVIASILIGMVLPALFLTFVFVGGIALMMPVAMIAIAAGIVNISV